MIPIILIIAAVLVAGITEYSARRERVDPFTAIVVMIAGRVVAAILGAAGLYFALAT